MGTCPFAIQHQGPAWKTNAGMRIGRGVVLHSAEGSLSGTLAQLDGPAQVSWHFTVGLDGTIYQHYDTSRQCWHAHAAGNVNYVGIEHENQYTDGAPDHRPFTDSQVAADILLMEWLNEGPYVRRVTAWEHHEVPGNSTSCPNGRIPWEAILAGLNPAPAILDGLGVEYQDGTTESTGWAPQAGKTVVSVGGHFTSGEIRELWRA